MSSLVTRFAVAVQSAKGTAATTGFYAMRLDTSEASPIFDYEDALNEHTGVHQRASTRQSTPDRVSKRFNIAGEGFLYPYALGTLLVGLGLNAATEEKETYRTHTFTKANVDAAKWLSVMHAIHAGSNRFERKVKDVRLSQLQLTATRQSIRLSTQGLGLDEAQSAGTETVVAEVNERIIPPTGSIAFGTLALGAPRGHTITMTRPVEEDDQKQHAFGLAGAEEMGFAVDGQLTGLDMPFDTYKKLNWGGASGTAPSVIAVTDSLTVAYESARNIGGASVPYRFEMVIAKADFRFSNFRVTGNEIVRCDATYAMIDDSSSAPVTIELDNGVVSY